MLPNLTLDNQTATNLKQNFWFKINKKMAKVALKSSKICFKKLIFCQILTYSILDPITWVVE